jgi:hypothetical protein
MSRRESKALWVGSGYLPNRLPGFPERIKGSAPAVREDASKLFLRLRSINFRIASERVVALQAAH